MAWGSWRLSRALRVGSERLLGILVFAAALAVAESNLLSFFGLLTGPWLLGLGSFVTAAIAFGTRRGAPARREEEAPAEPIARLIGLSFGAFFVVSAVTALLAPEGGWDALSYHLARLGYWKQLHGVVPFLANNPRVGLFPVNGNILQLPPVLFLASDRLCALAQLGYGFGAALAIYALARSLAASRASAMTAALLWLSIPAVSLQLITSQVDLVMSFFLAAPVYFLRRDLEEPSLAHLATALTAGALAVGTKPHTSLVLVAIGILLLRRAVGHHRSFLPIVAPLIVALAALVALPFYVQMVFRLGDLTGLSSLTWIHVRPALTTLTKNLVLAASPLLFPSFHRDAEHDSRIPFANVPDAYVGNDAALGLVWVVVALALSILAVRRRRSGAAASSLLVSPGALGVVSCLLTAFMMRHQPSVVRFLLPGAALITAGFAPILDGLPGVRGLLVRGTAIGLSLPLLFFHAVENVKSRVTPASWERLLDGREKGLDSLQLRQDADRYTPDVRPSLGVLAREARRGHVRLGLLSSSNGFERLAFGERFEIEVVPFGYSLPQSLEEVEKSRINSLLVTSWPDQGLAFNMFRHEMPRDAVNLPEDYLPSYYRGFDDPFRMAVGASMWVLDATPLVNMLTLAEPGWWVARRDPNGILLLKR